MMIWVALIFFLPLILCWGLWLILVVAGLRRADRAISEALPADRKLHFVIPAHNESLAIGKCLASVLQQEHAEHLGMVLVVADHCTDDTAEIVRRHGASVLERQTGPRGKPAALRDALAYLHQHGNVGAQDAFMILDADCTISPNTAGAVIARMTRGARVLQLENIIDTSTGADNALGGGVSVGLGLKNMLRPHGASRVGIPCQLFGTGMIFAADMLTTLNFEDHLTEDLKLSHTLLMQGTPVHFVPEAHVISVLPPDRHSLTVQRLRWEGGQAHSFGSIFSMFMHLLARGQVRYALALLDWSAPPLSMAVLYWLGMTIIFGVLILLHLAPLVTLAIPASTAALLLAYLAVGVTAIRGPLGFPKLLLSTPRFLAWKILVYIRMLLGRGAHSWERTPRTIGENS